MRGLFLFIQFYLLGTEVISASVIKTSNMNFGESSAVVEEKMSHLSKPLESLKYSQYLLAKRKVQQEKVITALGQLSVKIKNVLKEKTKLVEQGYSLKRSIVDLQKEIIHLEEERRQLQIKLSKNYILMREFVNKGLFGLVMNSKGTTRIAHNLRLTNLIFERNLASFKEFDILIRKLDKKSEKIKSESQKVQRLSKLIEVKESSLKNDIKLKNKILSGIQKSRLFVEEKLAALRDQHQNSPFSNDSGIMESLFLPNFGIQKGHLPSPLIGKISRGFGPYLADEGNITLNSKGIIIKAKPRSVVKAIFSGTVAYSGWVPGHSNLIVIDHGDHYYSVYGKLYQLKVKAGELVQQAQVIASTAGEGKNSYEGVYFEIRHFSEPYDPQEWVRGLTL